ncbi:hypothetical protein F2Q69_00015491 [Brassica cretica]|uniref:Uncharacterized protein n=1 Tax=Brassica cretica TaxID=69181 RepID=A0A8S9R8R8_BRACR|nr:hypothetical protein F2Q69_00015491 [Brassica cretica]
MFFRWNIGVESTDPNTELRKLRTKMHGYGMGLGSEWSTENWPRSPSELIRTMTQASSPGEHDRVADGESVEESYLHLFRREWNFTHEPVIDVLPAQRQRTRSRKGKGVASENNLGNPPLPEWNLSFSLGERSGTSEVPPPSDIFADLPPGFNTHESLDEESRRKVVAEGSSLINEGMRVFNAALDGIFQESRISHFKAEEAERELFRFRKEVEE